MGATFDYAQSEEIREVVARHAVRPGESYPFCGSGPLPFTDEV